MDEIDLTPLAKLDEGAVGDAKARHLIAWFNRGADGRIPWGSHGDFEACVRIAAEHMPLDKAKGFCANRHHDATGEWPGPHAHGGGHSHKSDRSTTMSGMVYGWAPITKVEDQPDGTVIVHGPMTDAGLDRDKQRFAQEWLDKQVPTWFNESGNIREQHDGKKAAGAALMVKRDESGRWDLAAHVVDPVAVLKVKTKTYKGFSIGVKEPHVSFGKADAPNGEIDGGYICETSLVDRPSNPRSLFTMVKADDAGNPVEVAEVVERDDADAEKADEPDLVKEVRHAPAGSPNGGQFLPGGTDSPSGLPDNRKGAEKVHVSAGGGKAGGSKAGARAGKSKTGGKTSARQMQTVMQAMQALGIKTGGQGMSESDAIKAVQKKLGMAEDGKMSPALAAKIRTMLAEHRAAAAKAKRDQHAAARTAKATERAKAAEQRKAAKQAAKQQATAAKKTAHKADDPNGDIMADDADLTKAISAEQRKAYADSGVAMPNGDFPIPDADHLTAALRLLGRYQGDKAAAKKHIVKRARALGLVAKLPDDWGVSKADEVLEQLDELGLWKADLDEPAELVKYDEADDIAGAQQAIACVARLIQSEAEELALGRPEEAMDIRILLDAIDALQFFQNREQRQAEMPDDRDPTAADVDDLDAPDVAAADKADTGEPADTTKVDQPELEKVDVPALVKAALGEAFGAADLAKMDLPAIVKSAVAEATGALEERVTALGAEVAKALAMPEPGGPVQIRTAPQQAQARAHETESVRAQIADLMTKADKIGNSDPKLAEGYRTRAEALERTLVG